MDTALKQRLIGALVLLAVGVIFLPVLFEPDHQRIVDRASQIPVAPEIEPVTIAEPVKLSSIEPLKPADQMYVLKSQSLTAEPAAAALDKSGSPDRNILDEKGVVKAWVVQVGSFNEVERASELKDQLLADGYPTFIRTLALQKRTLTRVYVGPKTDYGKAQQIKKELDSALKLDTLVIRFTP